MSEGPEGVIVGGWPFVIAAYSITAAALALAMVRLRIRETNADHKKELESHGK